MVERFRRDISPNERLYQVGARLSPPFAMQVFVEAEGRVDPARLRDAVAVASAACPGARLIARGRTWFDSGVAPPVRVLPRGPFDGFDFERAPFLRDPLDDEHGPTCEVVVLEGTPPTIVFRAFHGVMDGKGMFLWIEDVFRALRGEAPVGAPSPLTDVGFLARRSDTRTRPPLGFDVESPLGLASTGGACIFLRRTLEGSQPALVAKLATVVARHTGHPKLRFMIPVDVRRHDPSLRSSANLTLPIFLEVRRGEPWEDVHARLLEHLAAGEELALDGTERVTGTLPLAALVPTVRGVLAVQRATGKYLGSGILSHVGRVELAALSMPGFTATTVYSLPVHAPLVPFSFVMVDCGGHVEVTMTCAEDRAARAEALMDAVQALSPRRERLSLASGHDASRTVVDAFLERVRESPGATALTEGSVETTYAELASRACAVARVLAAHGIGRGALVGLLVDRTTAGLASLLGVLFAGAAYVPVDPQYPDMRIADMLDDAGASLCLTERAFADRVPEGREVLVVEDLPCEGEIDAVATPSPEDLAYVIYTSGSTGRPKGVAVEHRALASYVAWAAPLYRVDATARFALFTSLAFDLTLSAFVLPLTAGGSVALFPGELDPKTMRDVVTTSGANMLKLTPTHLELLTRFDPAHPFRTLIVGGEQLRGSVAARAQRAFGRGCRIVNEYGPTEATIGCVVHVFDTSRESDAPAVPIGVPVPRTDVRLLDANRDTVGRGAIGELYLTGAQLARGYLGRPELDRERFVTLDDGTRAYRTGDLGQLLPDGTLCFLGRADEQIKIRGHRIEPGEVESALESLPGVRHAFVTGLVPAGREDKVLCAFVEGEGVDGDALRDALRTKLPNAYVPSHVVVVGALPATVNGKIDVRALPDPFVNAGPVSIDTDSVDATTTAVLAIWSEVLGRDLRGTGPDADFHRLGGDSLTLLTMLGLVAQRVAPDPDAFLARTRRLVHSPTLARVASAAAGGAA